jgi:hypothetical protein
MCGLPTSPFQHEGTIQVDALRAGVFLIELLNIDLFNYSRANSHVDGFEGSNYQGMCVSAGRIGELFVASRRTDPGALPLAMASASTDRDKALTFALEEAGDESTPIPYSGYTCRRIDPKLLELYRDRFPTSVVTSICGVPIEQLSDYPNEIEVPRQPATSP